MADTTHIAADALGDEARELRQMARRLSRHSPKLAAPIATLQSTLDAALATTDGGLAGGGNDKDVALVRFRPHRVAPDTPTGGAAPWPHIRLDRALEFLIGDRLA